MKSSKNSGILKKINQKKAGVYLYSLAILPARKCRNKNFSQTILVQTINQMPTKMQEFPH